MGQEIPVEAGGGGGTSGSPGTGCFGCPGHFLETAVSTVEQWILLGGWLLNAGFYKCEEGRQRPSALMSANTDSCAWTSIEQSKKKKKNKKNCSSCSVFGSHSCNFLGWELHSFSSFHYPFIWWEYSSLKSRKVIFAICRGYIQMNFHRAAGFASLPSTFNCKRPSRPPPTC